jgi:peroxiredoxin
MSRQEGPNECAPDALSLKSRSHGRHDSLERLVGLPLESLQLRSLDGVPEELAYFAARDSLVIYFYPGVDTRTDPASELDADIAQACGFAKHHLEFAAQGYGIVGISTQSPDAQREWAAHAEISYCLASDSDLRLAGQLGLPTSQGAGMRVYQHLTLIVHKGHVRNVFYPLKRPDRDAANVAAWLCQV